MAVELLDRLRSKIAQVEWDKISNGIELTMSAGVCQLRANDIVGHVLARADKALYRAKEAGRNRVIGV
jgi:PleD family two-component response regulator